MSDGIFDGIFARVHRTFLLSFLEAAGSWIFWGAQGMRAYNEAAIELAAAGFF